MERCDSLADRGGTAAMAGTVAQVVLVEKEGMQVKFR